jgi:hypothetical protein
MNNASENERIKERERADLEGGIRWVFFSLNI